MSALSLRVAARSARFRATTAVAVLVLSAIGVAACAFAPVYLGEVAQAQLTRDLRNTSVSARGLALTSAAANTSPVDSVPPSVAPRLFGQPIASIQAQFDYSVGEKKVRSLIVNRSGACAHLQITRGRCPATIGEVVASASAAELLGLQVGQQISAAVVATVNDIKPLVVEIVGFYQPFAADTDYWFDHRYSSPSGGTILSGDLGQIYVADALIVGANLGPALASPSQYDVQQVPTANAVELPLRVDQVRSADIAELRRVLADARSVAAAKNLRADSQLPSVFDQVSAARRQASDVVGAFAIELALLILIVVTIIVTSAADQRRPDFALARLRGRTRRSAATMLFVELAPVVAVSVVPGAALAALLAFAVDRWWLGGVGRPAPSPIAAAAAIAVVVIEMAILYVIGRRAAGAPVQDLLRRVPPPVSRRGVGVIELAVAAVAVSGLVVVRSGARQNLLAVLTPALLALVVGLALARILTAIAARVGRRAMWRGRVAGALAALQFARRPGMRRFVILLVVAAALAVSAAAQNAAAAANRAVRGRFETGAAVVLNVSAPDPLSLASAVRAADSTRSYASPVVSYVPPGAPAAVTAVDPLAFVRVAAWGWPDDRPTDAVLARIDPALPPAVSFTGSSIRMDVRGGTLSRMAAPDLDRAPRPVYLLAGYRAGSGPEQVARLGPLPESSQSITTTLSATVACSSGCALTSLSVQRGTADTDYVTLHLPVTITVGGSPLDLGTSANWARSSPDVPSDSAPTQTASFTAAGTSGDFRAVSGSSPTVVRQLHQPIGIPTVVAGRPQLVTDGNGYLSAPNIDGLTQAYTQVGAVSQMPGPGGPGFIVDLALATQAASGPISSTAYAVWLGADDSARERGLVRTLAEHSITVTGRTTAHDQQHRYDEAAPAWSMRLAWVAAFGATALAILVLLITVATTARSRRYDLAAARQLGLSRRVVAGATRIEALVAVVVATVVGGVVGVIGAQLAAPSVPIFIVPVTQPAVRHPIEWLDAAAGTAVVLLTMVLAAMVIARLLTARTGADRLRGGT